MFTIVYGEGDIANTSILDDGAGSQQTFFKGRDNSSFEPELQCDDPVSVSSPMCLQEIKHLSQAILVYCLSKTGSKHVPT